jgi:hypothetical protein
MAETTTRTPGLADRLAIEDLFSSYLWALDTHDVELYVGHFWPDAEFVEVQLDGSEETWAGEQRIRDFADSHFGGYAGHQHRDSNRLFLPADDAGERWLVRSYFFTSHRENGEVTFTSTGHTKDVVERRGGEWRLAYRWVERWPEGVVHPFREAAGAAAVGR